jgi:hypothetical protein
MMTSFINFGCWNKYGCADGFGLSKVVSLALKQPDIDFFIVNGDNYYQDKDSDGKKSVNAGEMLKGFECLNKTDKDIFLLLGNHDIEITNRKCETLQIEKEFVDSINKKVGKNIYFPEELTMFKEIPDQNTLIIMIDTNIYANENPFCYIEFIFGLKEEGLQNDDEIIAFLKEKQEKLIRAHLIGKFYKNIIICGHHPLIGFKNQKIKKNKEGKNKLKGGIDVYNVELYKLFYEIIKLHADNFIYLCADIHNFQEGVVKINDMIINQFISGTGGADLDDDYNENYNPLFTSGDIIPSDKPVMNTFINIKDVKIEYEIKKHSSTHGFLVVHLKNTDVAIDFISTHILGGIKKQTRKRKPKTKYKRRKTNKKQKH